MCIDALDQTRTVPATKRRRFDIDEGSQSARIRSAAQARSIARLAGQHPRTYVPVIVVPAPLLQIVFALIYYAGLVIVMRLSGKRLAGQTTTFDLLVLITLGVVLQDMALLEGKLNGLLFIATVFAAHRLLALGCARSARLRRLVRGAPRPLVQGGEVCWHALDDENLSYDDLLAGLRKLGHDSPRSVRLATLEETGHISAIAVDAPPSGAGEATGGAVAEGRVEALRGS